MRAIHTEFIYCLACSTTLPTHQRRIVFTTGYYRVGVPLGCCDSCYSLSAIQEQFMGMTVPEPSSAK